jgi:hypothetical protein
MVLSYSRGASVPMRCGLKSLIMFIAVMSTSATGLGQGERGQFTGIPSRWESPGDCRLTRGNKVIRR